MDQHKSPWIAVVVVNNPLPHLVWSKPSGLIQFPCLLHPQHFVLSRCSTNTHVHGKGDLLALILSNGWQIFFDISNRKPNQTLKNWRHETFRERSPPGLEMYHKRTVIGQVICNHTISPHLNKCKKLKCKMKQSEIEVERLKLCNTGQYFQRVVNSTFWRFLQFSNQVSIFFFVKC